jgi:hypothetical protein
MLGDTASYYRKPTMMRVKPLSLPPFRRPLLKTSPALSVGCPHVPRRRVIKNPLHGSLWTTNVEQFESDAGLFRGKYTTQPCENALVPRYERAETPTMMHVKPHPVFHPS